MRQGVRMRRMSSSISSDEANEFKHIIVCGCRNCKTSHRFGAAEPDNIFRAFDDDKERECIVKKCLKYHCEKAWLVCVERAMADNLEECHVALDARGLGRVVAGGVRGPFPHG